MTEPDPDVRVLLRMMIALTPGEGDDDAAIVDVGMDVENAEEIAAVLFGLHQLATDLLIRVTLDPAVSLDDLAGLLARISRIAHPAIEAVQHRHEAERQIWLQRN